MDNINEKIIVLGASGFVGKSIVDILSKQYVVRITNRKNKIGDENLLWFDLNQPDSWNEIVLALPTVIINCIGYGVIKTQKEVESFFQINYIKTVTFYQYLSENLPDCKLIHIGTAFEYDLSLSSLTETSPLLPQTFYGISKLMASQYLVNNKIKNPFVVLRPFNMFGPGEDTTKIVPYLILAQKNKMIINLSSGLQKRDYFFVSDLALFIQKLIGLASFSELPFCINVGSGKSQSIKSIAVLLSNLLPEYDARYWNWGAVAQRQAENDDFYNASLLASSLGFHSTPFEHNLSTTIQHYWNL